MAVRTNIPAFRRGLNRTADRLVRAVDLIIREVATAIGNTVIDRTPVDTGEARSNWLPSLGVPIRGTIEPYSPYPKFSKANGQGAAETANAAPAKQRLRGAVAARQPGQSIIIQNNVDHITELNRGSSAQAPRLFVETAVQEGIRTLNGKQIRL